MDTTMQVEVAKGTLFGVSGLRVDDVKLFPGTDRDVTPNQMAGQINRVIGQLLAGDYDDITDQE